MRERGTGKLSVICVVIVFVFLGVAAWIENAGIPKYNADAFINCLVYDSIDEVINRVIELDQDDSNAEVKQKTENHSKTTNKKTFTMVKLFLCIFHYI